VLTPEEAVAEALALADELAGATPQPAASQAAERV
jgi:hypothetical protein